ncbi:MAG: biotin-dependent carboxyltransferase family protein [Desulfobacteraceae bacterium]|nr:biotin-dependent carboxyltransferase family protein [Desulfobacteraceae bacterium]
MDAIKIITPGGYSTIQDRGRFGFQNMGVPVSGVLDHFAFDAANLLVGNSDNTPVMELTVMGPSIEILKKMDIALTGAKMGITVNNIPVAQWQSLRVNPGDMVAIGQVQSGCRAYFAVSGGFDVPEVMGSFSTYVGAGIGGFQGRPLKAEDVLKSCDTPLLNTQRVLPEKDIPVHPTHVTLRAILGPQDDYFDAGIQTFFKSEYMVTAKADRMGYRLMGETIPIRDDMPKSIISEPSIPGSIQVPADEQPIILLVEQTVGGYAKIATIISSDLGRVAQTTPGDMIRFEKIDLVTAHSLIYDEKKKLKRINKFF